LALRLLVCSACFTYKKSQNDKVYIFECVAGLCGNSRDKSDAKIHGRTYTAKSIYRRWQRHIGTASRMRRDNFTNDYVIASKKAREMPAMASLFVFAYDYANYSSLKSSLPTPHKGHTKSSGKSSNLVPAAMPLSGSPTASS